MPTEAIGATAPEPAGSPVPMDVDPPAEKAETCKPVGLHSPPDSHNATNLDDSDSELSDLDDVADRLAGEGLPAVEDDDIGEILPDHWSGAVPVFKPTMRQFKDFKLFMEKVDSYGMQSGIVKIIPPQEWKDAQSPLDDLVKQIRVRDPIKQDIMGSNGTYRQVNILHQRSYNLPQWRQLCDQSEHQPPARRGERRANADKPRPATRARAAASSSTPKSAPAKKSRGRRGRKPAKSTQEEAITGRERPLTPVSPGPGDELLESVEEQGVAGLKHEDGHDAAAAPRMGSARQDKNKTQTVSARRKYSKREGSAKIDEAAFQDFDYRMDVSDYTPERCEELERTYWKTLTYAPPLYGADLMGTLFHESQELWNLNKLPNLLDVLGTKVPGVNTAYLYLGMWKATFAWHLEDVDLYSINYLHFGAPKQWYSISQKDARRFEAAMKNIWPTEAKACDQFLRHKGFLISPSHLKQHYNITVNKCVSYPGEFVVTYPYGYHSGYNLGYNCAEAVNFALDSWLPIGKVAKKCECAQAQDSVWVDVYEIERKMRGESTEYEETDEEGEEEEEEEEEEVLEGGGGGGGHNGLPSPPSSHTTKAKGAGRKRKRAARGGDGEPKAKKIRLRLKATAEPPCCLCPNSIPGAVILPTDDGRRAHRMCALYVPETYIETAEGKEVVANVANIDRARLDLKCLFCRSKKGACLQCSQKRCARSYHATCAAAAGVFVEEEEVPVFGEDGTEYKEQAFEFSCRFHRTKRDKKWDGDALEGDARTYGAAAALKNGQICQLQYHRGDIFAGVVVENRHDEQTLLLDIIPNGDRVEVDRKWLLLPDPADFRLPRASANAIPMPTSRKAKQEINATNRPADELPRKDEMFVDGFTWAEFHTADRPSNPAQARVDFSREDQVWYYLGKTSTESKAQYTESPAKPVHNPGSNFLGTVPKPVRTAVPAAHPRRSSSTAHATGAVPPPPMAPPGAEKPYVYKPRRQIGPSGPSYNGQSTPQRFAPKAPGPPAGHRQNSAKAQFSPGADPRFKGHAETSHSPNRFAPVGGHLSQPQSGIWSAQHATPGPWQHPAPMASSLLRPAAPQPCRSHVPQPGIGSVQKYGFFQIHHNRSSSGYRTPYAVGEGFTNGYEGNLRAFLMKAQQSLSGNKGFVKGIPSSLLSSFRPYAGHPTPANAPSPDLGSRHGQQSTSGTAAVTARPTPPDSNPGPDAMCRYPHDSPSSAPRIVGYYSQSAALPSPPVVQASGSTVSSAARSQYESTWQLSRGAARDLNGPDKRPQPGARSRSSTTPAFSKQSHSPIPLPPYVKSARQAHPAESGQARQETQADARRDSASPPEARPSQADQAEQEESGSPQGDKAPLFAADNLPDVPPNSAALVEKMMVNLRRASMKEESSDMIV